MNNENERRPRGSHRGVRLGAVRNAALVSMAASLFACGCMVGPDYQRPGVAVNDAWDEPTAMKAAAEASPADVAWWDKFNDPTLSNLVRSAFAQNLGLRVAGLRVLEARAARGIAVGQFFPQVQRVFGGIDSVRLSDNDPGSGGGDSSFASASIGFEAAWELDFWGKFRRGVESADAEVLASVADYDTVLVSLAAEVATNYILIRSLEERLAFARSNVMLQSETLSLTETRFRLGAVSELDVSTARATLANTQALIPELENALRQTKLALCVLLGRTPSRLEEELGGGDGAHARLPEAPAQIAAGIPADLLRRRPEVRATERLAAAQSARIGQATADFFPSISIAGTTGFVSSDSSSGGVSRSLGDIFDSDSFAGFIGLSVNWPILQYGRIQGRVRVQDARFEQAVALYQETVLRAAADVEAGLSEFLRARERSDRLAEAVDASKRSLEISLIQYRAGAVDFIRVNNAQSDLVVQEDTLVTARAAIALGAVRTYRALGGGWEVREGHEFVDEETAARLRERTDWGDVISKEWQEGSDLGFRRPKDEPIGSGGDR